MDPSNFKVSDAESQARLEEFRKRAHMERRLRDNPDFWVGFWCGFAICLLPGAALFIWILAQ